MRSMFGVRRYNEAILGAFPMAGKHVLFFDIAEQILWFDKMIASVKVSVVLNG